MYPGEKGGMGRREEERQREKGKEKRGEERREKDKKQKSGEYLALSTAHPHPRQA